jgi:hypothetical protein
MIEFIYGHIVWLFLTKWVLIVVRHYHNERPENCERKFHGQQVPELVVILIDCSISYGNQCFLGFFLIFQLSTFLLGMVELYI